ncbi:MAG TPA: hypothetical protein VHM01_01975 [Alphaproteobacteria bacterium]|nr:hypothetical protein [Alphaproteobacteria bacterium]
MSLQDDFRKAEGKLEAVDEYGADADAKVRGLMRKHGVKIAVGIAVVGGLLLLGL